MENRENPEKQSQTGCRNLGSDPIDQQISPRTTLEIAVLGGDSDNSSSSSSSSSSKSSCSTDKSTVHEALCNESHGLHWRALFGALKEKRMRRVLTFPPLKGPSRNFRRDLSRSSSTEERTETGCSSISKPTWRNFDYEELAAATDHFSSATLIGKGGHAEVYRGRLADGQLVAVKRLTKGKTEEERIGDFLSELGIIAHIDHQNAARLIGFGIERGLHLVLQFSPHGSLASLLHGSEEVLEWGIRFRVAVGAAEGLLYLHQGCQRRIIHRDIKASNILLTQDYQPQISDFGLAKWLPDKWTHHTVLPIEGTFGYLAPEYFMHGIVDEKTDVFAFGVLLLELVTGRRAVDSSRQSLVMWAKPLLEANRVRELVDPRLEDAYDPGEMARAMSTSLMCIHHIAIMRPHMNRVVQLLRGNDRLREPARRNTRPAGGRAVILDAYDPEEYTCSTYLNDLNRYKQLALE